jgi:N-acetylglucosamine malate deacetylase 1
MVKQKWPSIRPVIPAKKVLVLAPHMDDEIIGCGGTLIKYAKEGIPVSVVYITKGNKDIFNKKSPDELYKIRVDEAEKSAKIVGITNLFYLNNDDGSDENWQDDPTGLTNILERLRPDLIFLPYYADSHIDHVKTNVLLYRCMSEGFHANIAGYEVWSPIFWPTDIINISQEMDSKLTAIREHKSQLSYLRYDTMCQGINQYRSAFFPFPGLKYAEAFFCKPMDGYFHHDFLTFTNSILGTNGLRSQ